MGGRAEGGKSLGHAGRKGTDAAPEAGPLKAEISKAGSKQRLVDLPSNARLWIMVGVEVVWGSG